MSDWEQVKQSACLNCGHCSPDSKTWDIPELAFIVEGCTKCGKDEPVMYEQGWNTYATDKQVAFMQKLGFENASQNIIKSMAKALIDWRLKYGSAR